MKFMTEPILNSFRKEGLAVKFSVRWTYLAFSDMPPCVTSDTPHITHLSVEQLIGYLTTSVHIPE